MAKKIDLTQFRVSSKKYLKPEEENNEAQEAVVKVKKEGKKTGKVGRPTIEKEPLNSPLTINFTKKELEKIKGKAGLAPMTGYLREIIKNSGVI